MIKQIALGIAFSAAGLCASAITIDANQAVEMALNTSEDVKIADNGVTRAALQRGVARTAYLPNFSGSATAAWRLPDSKYEEMAMTLRMRGVYMAGISLTQPVYAGGKIVAANKLAAIGQTAASEQRRMTRAEVRANAESGYWTYVATLAKVEMMQSYKAQIDTAYAQTLTSVNAGMATSNDLQRIEARRAQIDYQLGQVKNGADLCRMSLCHLIGVEADTPITPADAEIPTAVPADLYNYDVNLRPEVKLLSADVEAKKQQVNMTRADFLPQMGVQAGWSAYGNIKVNGIAQATDGSYMPYSQEIKGTGWTILASLQVPIFHWGEGYKKVKAAKIDVDDAQYTLEKNTRLINLEVQQAISNVRTGADLLTSAQVAMQQADTNLANISQSYQLGLASLTTMLDAQSQWQASKSNLIEAQTQLRINCVEYERVTGRLE
jgi:outer membrane protein TolC